MDVLGALKYFRKKKKIAQKDVLPKKGKQTYRRIEIGGFNDGITVIGDYF